MASIQPSAAPSSSAAPRSSDSLDRQEQTAAALVAANLAAALATKAAVFHALGNDHAARELLAQALTARQLVRIYSAAAAEADRKADEEQAVAESDDFSPKRRAEARRNVKLYRSLARQFEAEASYWRGYISAPRAPIQRGRSDARPPGAAPSRRNSSSDSSDPDEPSDSDGLAPFHGAVSPRLDRGSR